MAESLFTTQTPGTQADAGHALTLGTVVVPGVAGQVTHGRWLFPTPVPSSSVAFVLYDATTQAELSRATFTGPTAGAWITVALSSPVSVSAGQRLVAAVFTPDRYVATSGFFSTAGLTNGSLSAPAAGSDPVGNGRFNDPGDAFPASTFGGNCYFVDAVFDASVAAPAQGSAGAGLDLAVAAAGGRRSSGAADAGLALDVAASGRAPARGTAAVDLAFGVDVRSGRAVVARPNTGAVVRPNTGLVVRP